MIVFRTIGGDQLVGTFWWVIDPDGTGIVQAHWVPAATWSDGTIVRSTGRFVHPPFGDTLFATGIVAGDVPMGWWMNLN